MPIVVREIIPPNVPCRAVRMLAGKLNIELSMELHMNLMDLLRGDEIKPEFLKMNPKHCIPTMDDEKVYLWDSRVIMTYLIDEYDPDSSLYPKDPKKRAAVDRMLYFDLGTLYKTQCDYILPVLYQRRPADPAKEEEYKKALQLFETILSRTTYAAGCQLTLADYSLVANLSFMVEVGGYTLAPYPKISAWMAKLKKEIPNYKEINDVPLRKFKEFLNSTKCQCFIQKTSFEMHMRKCNKKDIKYIEC